MARVSRPIWAFCIGYNWCACQGADEVGPRRSFMIDALNDLPAEARLTVDFEKQEYTIEDRWRVAPRHAFSTFGNVPLGGKLKHRAMFEGAAA